MQGSRAAYGHGSITDTLVFTDVNAADVTFAQNAGKDLIMILANGETITVIDHFDGDKEAIEVIQFADGFTLDAQGIRDNTDSDMKATGAVIGSGHVTNYSHSLGDGSYSIADYGHGSITDTLVFNDVNAADVAFAQNAGKDLIMTLANGETITVIDHFDGDREAIEVMQFADGSTLDAQGIRDKTVSDMKATGAVIGSEHVTNYSHSLGDGSYSIADYGHGSITDTLVFNDVNAADVAFAQNAGQDLIMTLENGETITVIDHFDGDREAIEIFQFADGTTMNTQDVSDLVIT